MTLWSASPDALMDVMRGAELWRAYLVTDEAGVVAASHEAFAPLAAEVAADRRDFHGHRAIFFELGAESGHLLTAFVHKTVRGQAAGGVRFWAYPTVEAMMRDGLRLSRGMGHKNALAGLWWGGGKGVIARRSDVDHLAPAVRAAVYRDYGRFISGLHGCYVTAEDAGTTPDDMVHVFETTRHTTCIPPSLGGSGNPSILTARGVVVAMEAAAEVCALGTLEGKVVVSQGLGNVARHMIGYLLARGARRIIGTDTDPVAVATARKLHSDDRVDVRWVAQDDLGVFEEPCDVFAPNAVGGTINPQTIPLLRARIVCGAANNQLEDPARDAALLRDEGIAYVPDFLANRMGIVSCANEQYGVFDDDPSVLHHFQRNTPTGIFLRTADVLHRASKSGRTTADVAEELAESLSELAHPIWGNRAQLIIDALVREGWADQAREAGR